MKAQFDHKGAIIGANIRRLRKEQGLSQVDLAARSKLSEVTIQNLERGLCFTPRTVTVEALARALKVPASSLTTNLS